MPKIIITTRNKGKFTEIKEIFSDTSWEILSLNDFENVLNGFDVEENATTYEGNAIIKAMGFGFKLASLIDLKDTFLLADDSGLEIDALGGRPGVKSARYVQGSDADRYNRILDELKEVLDETKRTSRYRCTVAIFNPINFKVNTFEGSVECRIVFSPRGDKSFGYSPICLLAEADYQKTYAECEPSDLTKLNHRGKAFNSAKNFIRNCNLS